MQARRKHAVISLLLEGNWLPITNVLVNQVGKYRYQLYSPHENVHLHIVIDVLLVSRTKVISVHCPIWIENATDLVLQAHLHVPTSLLAVLPDPESAQGASALRIDSASRLSGQPSGVHAAPLLGVGSGGGTAAGADASAAGFQGHGAGRRSILQPLKPGSGRFLPLPAMLDGLLYLTPLGAPRRCKCHRRHLAVCPCPLSRFDS